MLDIKLIREKPDFVRDALKKRNFDADFTELLGWDAERRAIIGQVEQMKNDRNVTSKNIPMMKKRGEDVSGEVRRMKELGEQIAASAVRTTSRIAPVATPTHSGFPLDASAARTIRSVSSPAAATRNRVPGRRRRNSAAASSIAGKIRSISIRRLPGSSATFPPSPSGHGISAAGADSVRATDSASGCPTNSVRSPVPANTSVSNGKITISKSTIRAIFGIRPRFHAHTCGLM